MFNEVLKNAVNVTYGTFREMIGQRMKISDNIKSKIFQKCDWKINSYVKNIKKIFNLVPSMVFIGVSLNF